MEKEFIEQLQSTMKETVDVTMKEVVSPLVEKSEATDSRLESIERSVQALRLSRQLTGHDVTGLSVEEKTAFVQNFINAATKDFSAETTADGGILIPSETYAGIFRIAQTVGLVAKFATRFPMNGISELIVPRYTGSSLQGEYVGENEETDGTSVQLGDVTLRTRTWQVVLRIPEKLLANAIVDVADWLMVLIAEGLAYKMDDQAFNGTGSPFVGILNNADTTLLTLATGKNTYAEIDTDDASEAIASLEESVLEGSAFFFHRTVLHSLRIKKDTAGQYLIANPTPFMISEVASGLRAQGSMHNFPVYTTPVLPSTAVVSQASTKFGVFGNLKHIFMGDGGSMEVAESNSAQIDGVNIFSARQKGFRINHDHALAVGLPEAFVVFKTNAS